MYGRQDLDFLERVFQKLLLNFTWWVNRKDADGKNVFEGGFLGLDNIGLFNRSEPLPTGGVLEQADSTGWMAFYCLSMLNIALELAKHRRIYEDIASKFFEHFIFISDAMTFRTGHKDEKSLWNEEDGFYYDAISWGGPWIQQLPVRSLVGLIPLYATITLEPELINRLPSFKKRVDWFIENRCDLAERNMASIRKRGKGNRILLSIVSKDRLEKILKRMLDEDEFFSDHGIRSLSKYHKKNPFSMDVNGQKFCVGYVPGDSDSGLFGGNSNWRGPIWLCVNFLLVESLQRFFLFYGPDFQVECPTGSGDYMHLGKVAEEIQHRLQHLFARTDDGRRSINGGDDRLDFDEHWKDYLWFHEFFDGDNGRGLGATHQCGWTGLIARMIHDTGYVLNDLIIDRVTNSCIVSTAASLTLLAHLQLLWVTTLTMSSIAMLEMVFLTTACLASGVHQPLVPSVPAVTLMMTLILLVAQSTLMRTGLESAAKPMHTCTVMSRKSLRGTKTRTSRITSMMMSLKPRHKRLKLVCQRESRRYKEKEVIGRYKKQEFLTCALL